MVESDSNSFITTTTSAACILLLNYTFACLLSSLSHLTYTLYVIYLSGLFIF